MTDRLPPEHAAGNKDGELVPLTAARIFRDRSGLSYRTGTWLELRRDHAWAVDAVQSELNLRDDWTSGALVPFQLFEVQSQATSRREFLLRPDRGRRLSPAAREEIARRCPPGCDLQLFIGDGLSSAAVAAQVPALLPRLAELAAARGWRLGQPFFVRYCRVGALNDVGDVLSPLVAVLLIGERPGLATAESLSAYLAYRPQGGHTDADRNLISNIHAGGVPTTEAAVRIIALAEQMRSAGYGGVRIKEPAVASSLYHAPPEH